MDAKVISSVTRIIIHKCWWSLRIVVVVVVAAATTTITATRKREREEKNKIHNALSHSLEVNKSGR